MFSPKKTTAPKKSNIPGKSTLMAIATVLSLQSCSQAPDAGTSLSKETQSESDGNSRQLNLHVASPDWRDQVIYFLMIDRFNDGDPGNNDQGYGEFDPAKESHYNGGDIPGIIQKLDYIKNLGATSVWLTPPVANQWWSTDSSYSGYHGYWARDFAKVDEHYGSLRDYQLLSHELHQRNMYLIQDIVVNHTGIFFGYDGEYDKTDTSKHFRLLEKGLQSAPDMPPFHLVDRLNPKHAEAAIYNWTPGASSYQSEEQQFTYQLGNLSDINTKNPQVIKTFKDIYGDWIQKVGVDAFRIDTVKYVEHEFWQQFLHDADGIYAKAKTLGKEHFLTFGEVFDSSKPYTDDGEKKVTKFLGTTDKPELNSVIGFPLYFEIGNVLGEGKPTKQLAYRLERFMALYPDPFITPNFIDNHDTKRFLAGASHQSLQQALALLFTIPGIPVIYQGTEQAHEETRQAMFAGGYLSEADQFDAQSEFYRFIRLLADIRTEHKVFTRGNLEILQSDAAGPGVLAYKREYEGKTALVFFNTADHSTLLSNLSTGLAPDQKLQALNNSNDLFVGEGGELSVELPARAIGIYLETDEFREQTAQTSDDMTIEFDSTIDGEIFEQDIELTGIVSVPFTRLKLLLNGNLDTAKSIVADAEGRWKALIPVRNFGDTQYTLQMYAPELGAISDKIRFVASVAEPDIHVTVMDLAGDDTGLTGNYRKPLQSNSQMQMDILAVEAKSAGANLQLTLTMAQISDDWAPANQFDNTSFSVFFDLPWAAGAKSLPLINAQMIEGRNWDLAHVAYGWGNYMYRSDNSSSHEMGKKVGISPQIEVDKASGTITFTYFGEQLGVETWEDVFIHITTWDISGEGAYRDISEAGAQWQFGGAEPDAPKVLDAAQLLLADDGF